MPSLLKMMAEMGLTQPYTYLFEDASGTLLCDANREPLQTKSYGAAMRILEELNKDGGSWRVLAFRDGKEES